MTRSALVIVFCASALNVNAQQQSARQEIDNVAAFARLYGVVRYFYPGDAAAAFDWNRFAVYGVRRVRGARDQSALRATLAELFAPLGSGIEIPADPSTPRAVGGPDSSLVAWRYRGAGISMMSGPAYAAMRTKRAPITTAPNQFATVMQTVPATAFRGKAIRLRGKVRVASPDAPGWAGLWLRVDRPEQRMGFFDNMQDRPVRDTAWREYVIQGTVADDAIQIAFGALASGLMGADVDDIDLAVRDSGAWSAVSIVDPGFESATAVAAGWFLAGNAGGAGQLSMPVDRPAQGHRFARLTLTARAARAASGQFDVPRAGASAMIDLAAGLTARVALSLSEAEARAEPPALAALRASVASVADPSGSDDEDVRLADVVVAWNVFRHFYPYWVETGVDWDARLRPQLERALGRRDERAGSEVHFTRAQHLDTLRALVADARDGHGSVFDVASRNRLGTLPIQLRVLDGRLVVTGTEVPEEVAVGSVVTRIDGASGAERLATEMRLASGTTQWRSVRAARQIVTCRAESSVKLTLEPPGGSPPREVELPCKPTRPPAEPRPQAIAELAPGFWYVDLTRAEMAKIRLRLDTLARAEGVIFDVRGYPTGEAFQILSHLFNEGESDNWMFVSQITGPFGQVSEWRGSGWNVQPAKPYLSGRRVFLTDGRAISYAESVMGHVRDHSLGTIIGGPTAGANGNVATFVVPGGFRISFTGMRVTRHDGRTPFHYTGVIPDIVIEPTLAGIRAGKDEVLERALAVLRAPR